MNEFPLGLYWSMPGPTEFIGKITDCSRTVQAIVLSLTEFPPLGIWEAIRRGLQNANIYNPVELAIHDGMNIDAEIGAHFGTSTMPPESLAHHHHTHDHAVVLRPEGARARQDCTDYMTTFIREIEHARGNIRLVVALHDGENIHDLHGHNIQVIAFDGALNRNEMEAYVSQRMVSVCGPGSTTLIRHLVTEFAGYDPWLAEQLIGIDHSRITALPDIMTPLLGIQPTRWTDNSWVLATEITKKEVHPLREWYAATHPGYDAERSKVAANKRYWRACLKAITPWMEERRPAIQDILRAPLIALENHHGGPGKIPKKMGTQTIEVCREDLEYSDMYYAFKTKFGINTSREQAAVDICKKATFVRHDLAHLRRPNPDDLALLISEMDTLVPS